MDNITYRTNYLKEVNVNGFNELDLGSMDFGNFDFGETKNYMVHYYEVGRPDIISQNIYGTTNLWWFVLKFNNVCDAWHDLRDGMIIKYPSLDKVLEAFKLYRK